MVVVVILPHSEFGRPHFTKKSIKYQRRNKFTVVLNVKQNIYLFWKSVMAAHSVIIISWLSVVKKLKNYIDLKLVIIKNKILNVSLAGDMSFKGTHKAAAFRKDWNIMPDVTYTLFTFQTKIIFKSDVLIGRHCRHTNLCDRYARFTAKHRTFYFIKCFLW